MNDEIRGDKNQERDQEDRTRDEQTPKHVLDRCQRRGSVVEYWQSGSTETLTEKPPDKIRTFFLKSKKDAMGKSQMIDVFSFSFA